MKSTMSMTYYIVYDRFTYANHLERERGNEELEPATVAAEIQERIEDTMRRFNDLSGKITVTIEIEE